MPGISYFILYFVKKHKQKNRQNSNEETIYSKPNCNEKEEDIPA